ncbi:MAG TPA: rod shape-determining protein MreC [Bacteroidia bacterium]|nr:rod shape-determining protein MreC [Bacteroidia bacterium]
MRSLFLLLWRNNFTLLFLLLLSFSFYFIIRNNNFQQVSVFNSTNKVAASILEAVNYVKEYINLKENNASLARENAKLKSQLPDTWYEKGALRTVVADSSRLQQYSYITARVINNTVNRRNNYLTLDRGSMQGVKKDMGVISSSGVVGIVKDVSDHYCTVMSVLHKNTRISTRFKNSNYFGSLVWEGTDSKEATLLEIAKHVKFEVGDTLITTVYSAIFPEGVFVGVVKGFDIKPGDNFYKIHIRLATNFANLSHVYIVDNLLKNEQWELEKNTQTKDDN